MLTLLANERTQVITQPYPPVTVYGKPDCPGCKLTASILTKAGIVHEYVDLTDNDDARTYVTQVLGVQQVPVVVADVLDKPIVGFRASALQGLIAKLAHPTPAT